MARAVVALTAGEGDNRPYLRLKTTYYTFTVGGDQLLAEFAKDERLFLCMRNGFRIHFFDPEKTGPQQARIRPTCPHVTCSKKMQLGGLSRVNKVLKIDGETDWVVTRFYKAHPDCAKSAHLGRHLRGKLAGTAKGKLLASHPLLLQQFGDVLTCLHYGLHYYGGRLVVSTRFKFKLQRSLGQGLGFAGLARDMKEAAAEVFDVNRILFDKSHVGAAWKRLHSSASTAVRETAGYFTAHPRTISRMALHFHNAESKKLCTLCNQLLECTDIGVDESYKLPKCLHCRTKEKKTRLLTSITTAVNGLGQIVYTTGNTDESFGERTRGFAGLEQNARQHAQSGSLPPGTNARGTPHTDASCYTPQQITVDNPRQIVSFVYMCVYATTTFFFSPH
jgi:hypothetical protein